MKPLAAVMRVPTCLLVAIFLVGFLIVKVRSFTTTEQEVVVEKSNNQAVSSPYLRLRRVRSLEEQMKHNNSPPKQEEVPDRDNTDANNVFTPQIFGGDRASRGEYGFYVQCDGCGATLIAPDMILSAAHCAGKIRQGSRVLVGAYEDWKETNGAGFYEIRKRDTHPSYNENEEFDFLVAKLTDSVPSPMLVMLNNNDGVPSSDDRLITIGMGKVNSRDYATHLQEVTLRHVSDSECQDAYPSGWVDSDCMFCATGHQKDACYGTNVFQAIAASNELELHYFF